MLKNNGKSLDVNEVCNILDKQWKGRFFIFYQQGILGEKKSICNPKEEDIVFLKNWLSKFKKAEININTDVLSGISEISIIVLG